MRATVRIVANLLRRVNGVKHICNKKNMSIFSERLKELRGAESQASFAAAVGINRVQYAKYEKGANLPSIDALERICRVHDCSADWLLGLRAPPRPVRVTAIDAGDHAVVTIGDKSRTRVRVTSAAPGKRPDCDDCPYKEKMKEFEAFFTATKRKGKRK